MLRWAVIFLVIALVAFALGASGIVAFAMNIAYVLLVIAAILFVINLVTGRRV